MAWQYTPVAVVLFVATGVSVALTVVALSRVGEGPAPAVTFVVVAVSTGVWSGGYALQVSAAALASKLFWHRVTWLGAAASTVAWPTFVVTYVDRGEWLSRARVAAAAVVPAVTALFVWLEPYSRLVLGEPSTATVSGFTTLMVPGGPLLSAFKAYAYAVSVGALALLVWEATSTRGLRRRQALALVVAGAVPVALRVLREVGAFPWWWPNPTPVSFAATTTLVA